MFDNQEDHGCLLQGLKHAFTYHWKVWTIPEVLELLHEAGFEEVHVWMRCMIVSILQLYHDHPVSSNCATVNHIHFLYGLLSSCTFLCAAENWHQRFFPSIEHAIKSSLKTLLLLYNRFCQQNIISVGFQSNQHFDVAGH